MTDNRLQDYLEHIFRAATDAGGFVEGLEKENAMSTATNPNTLVGEGLAESVDAVEADPFYSESNMRAIREGIQQLREGKVVVKTMDELLAMEAELEGAK